MRRTIRQRRALFCSAKCSATNAGALYAMIVGGFDSRIVLISKSPYLQPKMAVDKGLYHLWISVFNGQISDKNGQNVANCSASVAQISQTFY